MTVSTGSWPWPDSLDARTAAPRHHSLVLENERVRVLDTRIPVGDTVPVHTHRWPAVYYTISPGISFAAMAKAMCCLILGCIHGCLAMARGLNRYRLIRSRMWANPRFT